MSAADLVAGAWALISRLRARPLYEGDGEWSELPDDAADAIRALLDDRDALTQRIEALEAENLKLRGLLWYAWYEFNAIRARDGAPRVSDVFYGSLAPTIVSEAWWDKMTEAFAAAIGEHATTPWPSPEARAALQADEVAQ